MSIEKTAEICVKCKIETKIVCYPHREFGYSASPLHFKSDIWNFKYVNETNQMVSAYNREKPICKKCYLEINKKDPQIRGWKFADYYINKSYKEKLNGSKEKMMKSLESGILNKK